jgi:hypothetical protein
MEVIWDEPRPPHKPCGFEPDPIVAWCIEVVDRDDEPRSVPPWPITARQGLIGENVSGELILRDPHGHYFSPLLQDFETEADALKFVVDSEAERILNDRARVRAEDRPQAKR